MTKELVISANRHETKVAILEDDQLVEVYFQRANEYSLAGSIHKGRVTRVLPGMQSAFVDLGLERDTFLYVSDFFEENEEYDRIPAGKEERPEKEARSERGRERDRNRDRDRERERPERERPEREERPVELRSETLPGEVREALSEPGIAEPPETAAAEASGEAEQRGDRNQRDDRRRGRRRRNRGRGFPESKYASGGEEPAAVSEPESAIAGSEPVAAAETGFAVLPGESLAKYRRTPIEDLDAAEEAELEEAQREHGARFEEEDTGSVEGDVPGNGPDLETEDGSMVGPTTELPDNAFPEDDTAINDRAEWSREAIRLEEVPLPEDMAAIGGAAFAPAPAETAGEFDPAIGPETVDEATGQDAAVPEGDSAEPGAEEAAPEDMPAGTAAVREQGGRYMHRMPRRMRRRMRNEQQRPPREEAASPEGIEPRRGDAPRAESQRLESQRTEPQRSGARQDVRQEKTASPSITDLLKEGQEILVQVAKEPLGQKGARITSHIALPGRYVVYMPTLDHMGVSRKVPSDEERQRLKRILQTHRAGLTGGFIVRTAGEGKSEDEIAADMRFLFNLWQDIRQKAEKKPAPALLHHDLDIVRRILRDQLTESFKAIWVDQEEMYENVLSFVQRFQPALVSKVKLYTRPAPIFDAFNITSELEKALRPKVWLKSGGYIVINQTEALVAIDVNTGKYVGKSNRLEDTIVKTNTEAVKEIVRQMRLRDLGGIIVVDFIDMDERKNRQRVMQVLEEAMSADKAPYKVLQFNDFGLVAITRKRVKQSLERALCMPCPYCEGAGYVKSVQTIVSDIIQEAHKIASAVRDHKDVVLRVNPDVAKVFKSHTNRYLEELEEILRKPVLVSGDPLLHHEKFDLA